MHAVVARRWGDPDVLEIAAVGDPSAGPTDAVVDLRAVSVNWHDVIVRRTGRGLPLPKILGIDGAGVRRDTGEEVVILPSLDWGPREEAPGLGFSIVGDLHDGTYAEQIVVPRKNLFPRPPGLSWAESAAIPVAGLTAYRALTTRAGLRPGETVVVLGASGGLSSLAVPMAVALGGRVLVTSSREEAIARSRELGAEGGVLRTDPDWPAEIVRRTNGGADIVLDGSGGRIDQALSCLRPGGRVVTFGASAGATATLDVPQLYFRQLSVLGTTLGSPREFAAMLGLVRSHRLPIAIDSVRGLADARAAHERIESGAHFGKLVLTP